MMRYVRLVLGAVAGCFVAACSAGTDEPKLVCDAMEHTALQLAIRDAQTGQNVGPLATITATTPGQEPRVLANNPDTLIQVLGLAGTYEVRVQAPTYAEWTKSGIVVPADFGLACYPRAVRVPVNLLKLP